MNSGGKAAASDLESAPQSNPKLGTIEALEREFALGNYNLVRKCAKDLLASSDPALADFARELLRRTSPDPWLLALLGLSFVFFGAIALYVYAVGK